MNTIRRICVVTLSASLGMVALALPAGAEDGAMSLKDKQRWAEMTAHIDEKAAEASEKCGTKITAAFDIPSFAGQDLMKQSPTGACRDVVNTVTALCTFSEISKSAVQKSLSTITCRRSKDGTNVDRSGKEVVAHLDPANTSITGKEKGSYSWKVALEEILVAAPPSGGEGSEMVLKDRLRWAEMSKHIDDKAAEASDKCGAKISGGFDIPSFKGQDLMKQSPTGACRDAVNTVTAICASTIGKGTVQKSVATLTCRRSTEGTKVIRQGKTVIIMLDPEKTSITGKEKGGYSWKSAFEEIL
jgi:hypothetical protein